MTKTYIFKCFIYYVDCEQQHRREERIFSIDADETETAFKLLDVKIDIEKRNDPFIYGHRLFSAKLAKTANNINNDTNINNNPPPGFSSRKWKKINY